MIQIYESFEVKMLIGFVKGNFGMVFLLAIMNVASVTFYKLFRRSDLTLLLSLPISKLTMFKVKLFETFKDSLKSLAFPLPLYAAFMIIIKASALEWIAFIFGWMVIALMIGSFGVIASIMLASHFSEFGSKLILRAIALAVTLMFVIMFIGYGKLAESGDVKSLARFEPYISSRILEIFPTSWLVDAVNSWHYWNLAFSAVSFSKIALFLGLLLLVSARLYVSRFDKSWAVISERKRRKKSKVNKRSTLNLGIFGAMVVKEIKVIWREYYIWLHLIAPMMMVGFMLIVGNRLPGSTRGNYLLQASVVSITVALTHSLSSVGREGKMFSLIRTLPVNSAILLWAKALVGAIPNLVFTQCYLLISFFMSSNIGIGEVLFFGLTISLFFSLIGVSSGALFPRFDYGNPARAGAIGGSVLMYFLSSAYIGSMFAIEEIGLGVTPLMICAIIWLIFALVMSLLAAKLLQSRDVLV